jgi:hypothetical protein
VCIQLVIRVAIGNLLSATRAAWRVMLYISRFIADLIVIALLLGVIR